MFQIRHWHLFFLTFLAALLLCLYRESFTNAVDFEVVRVGQNLPGLGDKNDIAVTPVSGLSRFENGGAVWSLAPRENEQLQLNLRPGDRIRIRYHTLGGHPYGELRKKLYEIADRQDGDSPPTTNRPQ